MIMHSFLKISLRDAWTWTLLSLVAFGVSLLPDAAMAGGTIGDVLCEVVNWITGPIGSGIATLAIIIIGSAGCSRARAVCWAS